MGRLAWPPRLLLAVLVLLAVLGAGRLASAAQEPAPAAVPPPAPRTAARGGRADLSPRRRPRRGRPRRRPSQALLDAFGILRRERSPGDALPAAALRALRAAGLEPAGAETARLLRTTPTGGKAWVVPVADLRRALSFGVACAPLVVPRRRRAVRAARPSRSRARCPRPPQRPAPPGPARPAAAAGAPAAVTVLPPEVPLDPVARRPVEGVAVVALGDAAAGGGGSRADLVRGRAPSTSTPVPVRAATCSA